jgi:hypothetical protein
MDYQGTVHNGVVIFNGEPPLPDGAVVRVIPITTPPQQSAASEKPDPLFSMTELAVQTGLTDLAANADLYLNERPSTDNAR